MSRSVLRRRAGLGAAVTTVAATAALLVPGAGAAGAAPDAGPGPAAAPAPAATTTAAPAAAPAPAWVGSWATAIDRPAADGISAAGFDTQTLRQVTHLSIGGNQVRIRLTNVYGSQDLKVGSTTVALRGGAGGATTQGRPTPVTWSGSGSVTLAPGTERVSDPLPMTVPDDADLVISTWFPQPTGPTTWRPSGWSTAYVADGNAASVSGAGRYSAAGASFFFLDGVDVLASSAGAVVAFGDSITEGCCEASSVDANVRYPDFLADRLTALPQARKMGVLNAGISANRVISGGTGPTVLERFERDVLGQTGVRTVILMEGINDIGNAYGALDPADVIAVYRQFITRAHDAGIRVVGATLTPYEGAGYYTVGGEQDRQAVNTWIRTSGEFDAVVDFDKVVRDPRHPSRILGVYDPGDHLHPNAAGYAAMGRSVPLTALR